MPLVKLSEILNDAKEKQYAVGCFNVVNMESFEAGLEAAEENNSPIIFAIAQIHLPFINMERMVPMMRCCAEHSKVPVSIILDHAYSVEVVERAVNAGMCAIMYDISTYELNEHIEMMKKMVEYCHENGVEVEGELGYLDREATSFDATAEKTLKANYKPGSRYTTPEEAEEYISKTEVSALAVSIGNAHGQYTESAKLQFDLLDTINKVSTVPLVLHGSSGINDDDLRKAVEYGICKVNYYTGISKSAVSAIRSKLDENPQWKDYHPLMKVGKDAMKAVIKGKMKVLGSVNKVL